MSTLSIRSNNKLTLTDLQHCFDDLDDQGRGVFGKVAILNPNLVIASDNPLEVKELLEHCSRLLKDFDLQLVRGYDRNNTPYVCVRSKTGVNLAVYDKNLDRVVEYLLVG